MRVVPAPVARMILRAADVARIGAVVFEDAAPRHLEESPELGELKHRPPEGGGFGSRLKARLTEEQKAR